MNIKKDFFKGIALFAEEFQAEEKDVQLRLLLNPEEGEPLKYEVCIGWTPKRSTTYNEAMGNKIINLTETIVVPVLHQSMTKWARTLDVEFADFSAFLFKYKDNIAVAMYNGTHSVKMCPIDELMQ